MYLYPSWIKLVFIALMATCIITYVIQAQHVYFLKTKQIEQKEKKKKKINMDKRLIS